MAKGSSLKICFNRQSGICAYCHHPMTLEKNQMNSVTRDHIVPRSADGPTSRFNIVAACYRCNQIKGSMPLCEFISSYRPHEFPVPKGPVSGNNVRLISNLGYAA